MDTVSCHILGKFQQELSHTKIGWSCSVDNLKPSKSHQKISKIDWDTVHYWSNQ